MKQTAVEWLAEQYNLVGTAEHEQAKKMEKQQIIDACNLQRNDYKGMPTYNKSGEQYYNETFNKPSQWYNEDQTNERMNVIGQNGNNGEHYNK